MVLRVSSFGTLGYAVAEHREEFAGECSVRVTGWGVSELVVADSGKGVGPANAECARGVGTGCVWDRPSAETTVEYHDSVCGTAAVKQHPSNIVVRQRPPPPQSVVRIGVGEGQVQLLAAWPVQSVSGEVDQESVGGTIGVVEQRAEDRISVSVVEQHRAVVRPETAELGVGEHCGEVG